MLSDAIGAHGIRFERSDEFVEVAGTGVRFWPQVEIKKTTVGSELVQLNVAVTGPKLGERTIWQSLVGFGDDIEAMEKNAFARFLMSSYHVILNTLADHRCEEDGTEWADWIGETAAWRVCDSPLVTMGAADPSAIRYSIVHDEIKRAFLDDTAPGLHWVEVFFAFVDGKLNSGQVERDGQEWIAGAAILQRWEYAPSERYLSGRHFLIALPVK